MKRTSLRFAGILAGLLGLLAMTAAPGGATTVAAGGGAVTGTVTIAPGITLTPGPTSYTFAPITLAGAVAAVSNDPGEGPVGVFAGTITTSVVTGSSAAEDCTGSTGTVNPFTFSSVLGGGTINGTLAGGFTRVGPLVVVTLNGNANINSGTLTNINGNVTVGVAALFVPTSGDCVTSPITSALFAGAFGIVGVS